MAVDTCRSSPAKRGKATAEGGGGGQGRARRRRFPCGLWSRRADDPKSSRAWRPLHHASHSPRFAGEDLLPSCRTLGRPDAKHYIDEQGGVEDEAGGDGREEAGDAEPEPVHRGEPGAGADEEARRVGAHRAEAAAEALADEEEPEPKPETHVRRSDDPEIQRTETGHLGVVAEQTYPEARLESHDRADRAADRRDRDGSRPGDPPRPAHAVRHPTPAAIAWCRSPM